MKDEGREIKEVLIFVKKNKKGIKLRTGPTCLLVVMDHLALKFQQHIYKVQTF